MQTESATTFDFGYGPVPAHRHKNPDGSVGGWVANTARVSGNAWVSDNARVSDNAWVSGNAWVSDTARVSDTAWVACGKLLNYNWTAFINADGSTSLHYGCECLPLDEFEKRNGELAKLHEPRAAAQYEAAIAALIVFVRATVKGGA